MLCVIKLTKSSTRVLEILIQFRGVALFKQLCNESCFPLFDRKHIQRSTEQQLTSVDYKGLKLTRIKNVCEFTGKDIWLFEWYIVCVGNCIAGYSYNEHLYMNTKWMKSYICMLVNVLQDSVMMNTVSYEQQEYLQISLNTVFSKV